MDNNSQQPKVGIGVMILKGNKVLLGLRKNSHGAGEYAFPGGHLEYQESFKNCALREIAEECGVKVKNLHFQCLSSNSIKYTPHHYILIGLVADWESGEPQVLEPDRCENWQWFDLNNLPDNLFEMSKLIIDSYQTGKNYFDL